MKDVTKNRRSFIILDHWLYVNVFSLVVRIVSLIRLWVFYYA